MHSRKSGRIRRHSNSAGFLQPARRGAVRYFAESLEGRVMLSGVLYDSPQADWSPAQPAEPIAEEVFDASTAGGSDDLVARLSSHTLTAEDMAKHRIAEVEWGGQRLYAKPNEWVVDLDSRGLSPERTAADTLNQLGFGQIYQRTLGRADMALVRVPSDVSGSHLAAALRDTALLESIDPNGIIWSLATPTAAGPQPSPFRSTPGTPTTAKRTPTPTAATSPREITSIPMSRKSLPDPMTTRSPENTLRSRSSEGTGRITFLAAPEATALSEAAAPIRSSATRATTRSKEMPART